METVHPYLTEIHAFLREGFGNVNAVKGLIIALVAAFMLTSWNRIWVIAAGAAMVHVISNILIPVVANHAPFKLPHLVEPEFWRYFLTLYLGYVIVIAAFFFVKKDVLKVGAKAAH